LIQRLTREHRQFLVSLALAEPQWELIRYSHLKDLPAIKWKVVNLQKLARSNPVKLKEQAELLRKALF